MTARTPASQHDGLAAPRAAAERRRAIHWTRFEMMSELQSRVLLATEAIVICAPLTVLLLVRVLPAQVRHVLDTPEPAALGIFASGLFMLAALVCLWWLIVTFAAHGSAGLRRVSTHVWALAALAGVLALRAAFHLAPAGVVQRSWLNQFAWGVPFVVPLAHVCLERWLRGAPRTIKRI